MIRLVVLLLMFFQVETDLSYGDGVLGEITEQTPQVRYTFEGQTGDVVAIEMRSADRSLSNPLSEPVLILLNTHGVEMQTTQPDFPVDDTLLVAELPGDGVYTIIATRDETVPNKSVGAYQLHLMLVPYLEPSTPLTDSTSNDRLGQYYAVKIDEPFDLTYQRRNGTFWPEVSVHVLSGEHSGYAVLALASGRGLTHATLGAFESGSTYLVVLREAPFEYYGESVQVQYSLYIEVSEE